MIGAATPISRLIHRPAVLKVELEARPVEDWLPPGAPGSVYGETDRQRAQRPR